MNIMKLTPETINFLETLGNFANLGDRKAYFLPYIMVQHNFLPPDQFELILMENNPPKEWDDYQRLTDPNIVMPDVV